jgi:hypothetical protein
MQKILNANDYTLIFSKPNVIMYGSVDGNLYVYQDEAEEFAKSFFSKDILEQWVVKEKDLERAKKWLVGILYHERDNSIHEVMDLTGYKSSSTVHSIIKKSGNLRSIKEGTELAFQRRYGGNLSEVMKGIMQKKSGDMSDIMKDKWDNDKDGNFKKKISRTSSDGMKRYWERRKEMVINS